MKKLILIIFIFFISNSVILGDENKNRIANPNCVDRAIYIYRILKYTYPSNNIRIAYGRGIIKYHVQVQIEMTNWKWTNVDTNQDIVISKQDNFEVEKYITYEKLLSYRKLKDK